MKSILLSLAFTGFMVIHIYAENIPSVQLIQSFFKENKGQVVDQEGNLRHDVKFMFYYRGFKMILKENSWSYEFSKTKHIHNSRAKNISSQIPQHEIGLCDDVQYEASRTDIRLLNSNPHPSIIAEQAAGDVMNYYSGKNPVLHITGVRHYRKITYRNIYPLIDFEIKIADEPGYKILPIEYSFIIHPGGNPELIQLSYEGNAVMSTENNALHLKSSLGIVEESSPIYIMASTGKKIKGALMKKGNIVSFHAPAYDHSNTFIIDPIITYSTYFGGDSTDYSEDMKFDENKNIIVCGRTASDASIATSGAYDNTYGGGSYDMYLLKFNPSFQLQWATYFGGDHVDYGWSLAIDAKSNIYLGGESYSDALATPGAEQKTIEGSESDGLVAKFTPDGALVWSRYFGGSEKDQILSMVIDHTGRLIITGYSLSADSISTPGAYQTIYAGNGDIVLAALDTATGNTIWSTYYGANKDDRGHHVIVDGQNQIYVSGTALSTTGIATSGTFHSSLGGFFDGFLVKFSSDGIPIWGTYVGGAYEDRGRDCVIDHDGNICMTGFTQSDTGIATAGTWKQFRTPGVDSTGYNTLEAFLIKFDTGGHRIWGTYFGDTLSETARGIDVNIKNDIFITGATYSSSGIATGNAYQTKLGGISDAYFAKFDSSGNLVYSSYFGGSGEEQVGGYGLIIRTDDENNFYLCSSTLSADSIATPGAFQTAFAGGYDVFIAKFADTLIADGAGDMQPRGSESELIIYPNPARDVFRVRVETSHELPAILSLFSCGGKLMMRKAVMLQKGKNEFQLTLNKFSSGVYLITMNDGDFLWEKKVIID
ncbi:MAG: SBBP repeat-containing protein [Chitinophagales bacterium]